MLGKLWRVLIDDPGRIPTRLLGDLWAFQLSLRLNVVCDGNVTLIGRPLIDIHRGSKLYLGNGVLLTSRSRGYHLGIHSPVKLFADRPGAEIRIGDQTRIAGSCIHAQRSVVIGKRCLIAANCQIIDNNGHDLSFARVEERMHTSGASFPVVIEDDVWLGANSVVLPGVRIGRGAVIGANSVVSANIPPMTVARGNPAEVVFEQGTDARQRVAAGDPGMDWDVNEPQLRL
jgi:acetyltransferase-like isoleucine patch superfamily enzyme